MLSHSQIKHIQSLQQKKFRRQHGVFLAEGEKIVSELLQSHFTTESLYALEGWLSENRGKIPEGVKVFEASYKDLERISGLKTPNKVLAVAKTPEIAEPPAVDHVLVLDTVQDPGNLGTIIRTADWFGIRHLVCSPETAEVFSPKVIQASMGSFLRVNVYYTELPVFLKKIPEELPIFGAFLNGENIASLPAPGKGVLIVGNEANGISAAVSTFVAKKISIPRVQHMGMANIAESLNASVAAGILMAWMTAGSKI